MSGRLLTLLGLVLLVLVVLGVARGRWRARQLAGATEFAPRDGRAVGRGVTRVGQDHEFFLNVGGRKRRYEVHLPSGYDPARVWAVVLNCHGGAGSAQSQRRTSRMDRVADREGFVVVYPEGTAALGRMYTFNAGRCCGYARNHHVDDVAYIRALLDDLAAKVNVDRERIYSVGISNGAMLSYRLGAELSDRIAAIGAVAGNLAIDDPRPARPVPLIHIHGLKDPNVQYAGGVGPNALDKVNHRSVADSISIWARLNGCGDKPTQVDRQTDYVMEVFAPPEGRAGAPVVLYTLPEGGHNWPGGVDVTRYLGTGKLVETFDASSVLWRFLSQFKLSGGKG